MKVDEAIKAILKANGKSQTWLAEKVGYSSQSAISQMLGRGNINLNTLCVLLDALDYEITIQPKRRAGARPAGQVVLESKTEGLNVVGRYDPSRRHLGESKKQS